MTDTHIKIKPVVPKVQYTGNGVTTTFPYSFAIFDETDMVVYEDNNIITTGFSVTGAGQTDGGNVVFDTAPADGVKITLLRSVTIERITDFQEGGSFRPKNINDEFDRQTAFAQQLEEKISRSMVVPPTSEVSPEQVLEQVNRIYQSIDNIDAVADDQTNLDSVAAGLSDISTCASNMSSITDAPTQAGNAATSATNAENSAIAAANSAASMITLYSSKMDKDASNATNDGKAEVISWGRQLTNKNTTVAQGNVSIADAYDLGMTDVNSVKLGLFYCILVTTGSGTSSMSLKTDVMTDSTVVCKTNNQFGAAGTVLLPFKNTIRIGFPETGGGVGSNTKLVFVGYM